MLLYIVCLSVCAYVCAQQYADIDLSIDMATFIEDKETLKKFTDCFLDRTPCDDVAAHYKRHISEALEDGCKNCSPKLKHNVHMFNQALKLDFPEDYTAMRNKYDPDGTKLSVVDANVQTY